MTTTRTLTLFAATVLTLGLASATNAFADSPIQRGKTVSRTCTACHGANGINSNPLFPNLAGQHKAYIIKQLKAFKSGTRKDPIMSSMAKALSNEDINNVAAYFSSRKPCHK